MAKPHPKPLPVLRSRPEVDWRPLLGPPYRYTTAQARYRIATLNSGVEVEFR